MNKDMLIIKFIEELFKEFIMKQLDIKDLEKISGGITEGGCVLPVINFSWMRWF